MLRSIVAATDFSTRSQRALRRAGRLAKKFDAELTLVHVVDGDQPKKLIELESREAEKLLAEQIVSMSELRDTRCRTVVTIGETFNGVLKTAKNVAADLIVMGSHRKQILRDIFIGTTIERVIRTGPYPVLMVNTDTDHFFRNVIAGVDVSESSAYAIMTAKNLGLIDNSNLTVVHAFTPIAKGKLYVANVPQEQIDDYVAQERSQANEALKGFLTAHHFHGVRSTRTEEGSAFAVISRVVKEVNADLVVIGTHGRTGIAKMLLGSVAEEVLSSLDVDVLAVPSSR